ncbi:MAG: transposase [Planctomycetota bacterium]|jgi:transposase
MWQYKTWIEADVPRVECREHGVQQIQVPWSEVRSRFTAPFECPVIDWLLKASVGAVKEAASKLWHYKSWTWAKKAWGALLEWAGTIDSARLQRVVVTIGNHLLGILNAIVLNAANAGAESIKARAEVYREARDRNPDRWSEGIRNWTHLAEVTLNQ